MLDKHTNPIVYYDGICGLCNKSIQYIYDNDAEKIFYFAPLQGMTASSRLSASYLSVDTVVLEYKGVFYSRSEAILQILRLMKKYVILVRMLSLLPRGFRDFFYRIIARHRYRIWGQGESCRFIPTSERYRFLP